MACARKILTLREEMEVVSIFDEEKLAERLVFTYFDSFVFFICYKSIFVSVFCLYFWFKIGKSQAARIIGGNQKIQHKWQSGVNVHKKRLSTFIKNILSGICVPVKAKDKELVEELNYGNFSASTGWLEKWRNQE